MHLGYNAPERAWRLMIKYRRYCIYRSVARRVAAASPAGVMPCICVQHLKERSDRNVVTRTRCVHAYKTAFYRVALRTQVDALFHRLGGEVAGLSQQLVADFGHGVVLLQELLELLTLGNTEIHDAIDAVGGKRDRPRQPAS